MIFTSDYSIKMPVGRALLTAVIGILTVLLILAVIDLLIMLVSKIVRTIDGKINSDVPLSQSAEEQPKDKGISAAKPLTENESQGNLELHGVDEPTAAVIMAIVSNQSGIPLNRLCFKSIRLLEDESK